MSDQANENEENNEMSNEADPLAGIPAEVLADIPPAVLELMKDTLRADPALVEALRNGQAAMGLAKIDAMFMSNPPETGVIRLPQADGSQSMTLMLGGHFITDPEGPQPDGEPEHVHMAIPLSPPEALDVVMGILQTIEKLVTPMQLMGFTSSVSAMATRMAHRTVGEMLMAEHAEKHVGEEADAWLRSLTEQAQNDAEKNDDGDTPKDA